MTPKGLHRKAAALLQHVARVGLDYQPHRAPAFSCSDSRAPSVRCTSKSGPQVTMAITVMSRCSSEVIIAVKNIAGA